MLSEVTLSYLQVVLEACQRSERLKFSEAQKLAADYGAKYKLLLDGQEVEGLILQTCNELWREAKAKYR